MTIPAHQTFDITTSRFQSPEVPRSGRVPVGIVRYPPRFPLGYRLRANLLDLAPTPEMLAVAKQPNGRGRFIRAYRKRLDKLGRDAAAQLLGSIPSGGAGLVLLCYENLSEGDAWCHRRLLAEWLEAQLGISVPELPDVGRRARRR